MIAGGPRPPNVRATVLTRERRRSNGYDQLIGGSRPADPPNRLSFTRRTGRSGRARSPAGAEMTDALNATPQQKSEILMQALPHMLRYDDTIVVVKYGGHAMGDEQKARNFAKDMVLLEQSGINPVVVHGGGPQIG